MIWTKKKYFIYITTNLITGAKYIGKHCGYEDDNYLGSGKILKHAIKKYGKENFNREIIEFSDTEEENCEKERYYIALYNATSNPMFYNIHEGGNGGNTTAGFTPEEKKQLSLKMSEARRGENNGMYGKHHSQQTKEYLSFYAEVLRDNSVYRTPEFRQKMSEKTSGANNGMYGKKHSEESKRKMSKQSIGKTLGEKNGMYGKKGEQAINGKTVQAFNENGELIHTFNTVGLALKFLNLKGHSGLYKAIKEQTLYKGFY